jgi:acyl-CoA dehydrogenase
MHRRRTVLHRPRQRLCAGPFRVRPPIGENQGIQFPIARAYVQVAARPRWSRKRRRCSTRENPAAPKRTWRSCSPRKRRGIAADMCIQTHGGFGFAEEFDIERKFRETRLYQVAPISTNLILSHVATHVLDLPKSF